MQQSFTTAFARLKQIHTQLASQEMVDIDTMLSLQKEAKDLHAYLQAQLQTAKNQHKNLLSDMNSSDHV